MKNLNNILEGLLDVDFDISVEPVEYKFKNDNISFQFGRFLNNYNAIVASYAVCNQALEKISAVVDDLESFEYQTSFVEDLAQGLKHSIKGYSAQISEKDYKNAIDYLEGIRPVVKVAMDAEKVIIKLKAPKNIMFTPICGSESWFLNIYQERYISGPNWIDENLDKLTTALKKMKNVTNVEYSTERHSIYVQVK